AQANLSTQGGDGFRDCIRAGPAKESAVILQDGDAEALMNIADRVGSVQFAKDPETGTEIVPQVQPGVWPGPEEVVTRPRLGHAADYGRVEVHRRQAHAHQPAEVESGTALVMRTDVIEIDNLHVEPALERAVAHRIEFGDDGVSLGGEEAIGKHERAKV